MANILWEMHNKDKMEAESIKKTQDVNKYKQNKINCNSQGKQNNKHGNGRQIEQVECSK